MFNNLVTYHLYKRYPMPANDALAYQYILAGNGIFIRTETRFFEAVLPVASCTVRGLEPLHHSFQLNGPRIPTRLLDTILSDARRARRPDWRRPDNGLNEVLYQFHHHGQTVQVKKPPQQATPVSILAPGSNDANILCDLHSHGNVHTTGGICHGNTPFPVCSSQTIQQALHLFMEDSLFNADLSRGKCQSHSDDVRVLWAGLDGRKRFLLSELVTMNMRLQDLF